MELEFCIKSWQQHIRQKTSLGLGFYFADLPPRHFYPHSLQCKDEVKIRVTGLGQGWVWQAGHWAAELKASAWNKPANTSAWTRVRRLHRWDQRETRSWRSRRWQLERNDQFIILKKPHGYGGEERRRGELRIGNTASPRGSKNSRFKCVRALICPHTSTGEKIERQKADVVTSIYDTRRNAFVILCLLMSSTTGGRTVTTFPSVPEERLLNAKTIGSFFCHLKSERLTKKMLNWVPTVAGEGVENEWMNDLFIASFSMNYRPFILYCWRRAGLSIALSW